MVLAARTHFSIARARRSSPAHRCSDAKKPRRARPRDASRRAQTAARAAKAAMADNTKVDESKLEEMLKAPPASGHYDEEMRIESPAEKQRPPVSGKETWGL